MSRIESAIKTIEYFDQIMAGPNIVAKNDCIAVAKNEKILPEIMNLLQKYGAQTGQGLIGYESRQRRRLGDMEIKLIRAKDAVSFLQADCRWAITSLDALCEWAALNGYSDWKELTKDFEVNGLGIGKCTVEIACKPTFPGLIEAFKINGLTGLKNLNNFLKCPIASDLPGLAGYFFPETKIKSFGGSLEVVSDPLIVGVVETGESLKDEGWVRLSDFRKEAVLINSQTCIMRERR